MSGACRKKAVQRLVSAGSPTPVRALGLARNPQNRTNKQPKDGLLTEHAWIAGKSRSLGESSAAHIVRAFLSRLDLARLTD